MLKLKTKTEFQVPSGRGTISVIIRLIVESVFINKNYAKVEGYYYYNDENNSAIVLSRFGQSSMVLREDLTNLEQNLLTVLPSTKETFLNLDHRSKELTLLTIKSEYPINYNTTDTDWEDDI